MSGEWPSVELRTLVEPERGISYGIVQPGNIVSDGVPVIRVSDVRDSRIKVDAPLRVSKQVEAAYSRTRLRGGELLITIVGTVGETAIVPDFLAGWNVARAIAVLPIKPEIGARWVKWALLSPAASAQIQSRLNTTVQATLNLGDLAKLPILLPPPPEREKIEVILGALDDKIELNRHMNQTLEAIAQAIFKDWFIDFGPTRAKMEGLPPYLAPEIWTLFPDRLDVEGKPMRWHLETISNLCSTITNGGTPSRAEKSFWVGGHIPWFKTGELADSFLLQSSEKITASGLAGSSVKLLPKDSVVMAIYAAPTVGRLGILTEPATFNQACTGMVPKSSVGLWFLYLSLLFGRDWFNGRANGAAQQNISKAIVESYQTILPTQEVLTAFDQRVTPLFNRVRANREESFSLLMMRELLLPKLMSGEVHMKEVKTLGQAT